MVLSKALVTRVGENNKASLHLEDVEVRIAEGNHVLVRLHAVAQNPTDVQSLDSNAFGNGAVLGCDFSGTIRSTGVVVTRVKEGDVVAGLVWGGEIPGLGGYSEYSIAHERICFTVPKAINYQDAATIPLASTTAWLALFSKRCLDIDKNSAKEKTPVLVWGGSSSVGLYTIQLARIFSIPTVAICSSKHFDLCRSMGASWVFDYRDSEVVQKIKADVPNLQHVFDCIGSGTSSTQASQAIESGVGGKLCTVRPGKVNTENVSSNVAVSDVLVWTAFLKDHSYKDFKYPASKEDHELAAELFVNIPVWLEKKQLRPNSVRCLPGGLSAVPEGFQFHRDGKVSGFKLVYEL